MESKKINQLATELTPALSDLTIIGDPTTGISKKITLSQMASLFTGTVEEYANVAAFPLVGVADTIYIALDTNVLYRWNTGTSAYVELSPNIINSLVFSDANGFDGTISLVGSTATLTITTALTTGSVGFIGASGALLQDNANFFWDDSNNRLGIGTNAPTTAIDTFGSGIITRVNGTSTNNAFIGFASAGSNKWSVGNVQSDHRFRIYNEATTSELVSVLQTGEFGIGIANPTTKLHIDGGASALIANLDANVSVAKSVSFRSDNSNRINLEVSGTESGSNAGANFFLRTYTDLGALIETPFQIIRSTGVTTIKSLTLTNALSVANGGTGVTSLGNISSNDTSSMTISGGTGAIIGSGVTITLLNASATNGGIVSTGTQTFEGAKTFLSSLNAASGQFGSAFSVTSPLSAFVPSATDRDMFQVGMIGVSNGFTLKRVSSVFQMEWAGNAIFSGNVKSTQYYAESDNSSSAPNQFQVNGATNSNKQLIIGYNTTNNGYGSIQAIFQGVTTTNLALQSNGGNVGIGMNNPQTLLSIENSGTQNVISPIITSQSSGTTYAGIYSIRDGAGDQRGLIFQNFTANVGLTEKLRISSNGYIGINKTDPATFLHIVGSNTTGRGQLSIQSNNTSNAARISFYYDTNLQGNVGTTSADFYVESVNTLVLLPGNGNTTRGGTIREFAGAVSPPSPYTADLRLNITHDGWGGNNDSGTVYVEYQGRAYGNNQTTTAFGVITYRLDSNGLSITNVSTAGVTVSNVTLSTNVSSNYILRVTFGVSAAVDRASIFARTTNSFVSSISVDTV